MLLASPASYFFARRQQAAWAKAIWICILILVFGAHQLDTGLDEKVDHERVCKTEDCRYSKSEMGKNTSS
jgi:hypothetical protein